MPSLRLLPPLCLALSLAAPTTATAQQPALTPGQIEFAAQIKRATSAPKPAVGLAAVAAMERLRSYVPTAWARTQLEPALVATRTKNPLVHAALARLVTHLARDLQDASVGSDGMRGPVGQLGCLTSFLLVGPMDNTNMEGFATQYGQELGELGPYAGKFGEVDWRPVPAGWHNLCVVTVGALATPAEEAVVYLASQLDAKKARQAKLLLGTGSAYKVWLNGQLVGQRDEGTGFGLDNDAWAISLKAGKNDLLIKLASSGESSVDVSARLVDTKLIPVSDVVQTPFWAGARVQDAPAKLPVADPAGALAQARSLATTGSGEQAVWAAWLWKQLAWRDASTPWRDAAERLALDKTVDPLMRSLLASLFEERWRKLELLEQAHTADPDNPWITMRLADALGDGNSEADALRQRALYESILKTNPDYFTAAESLASWYSSRQLANQALAILERHASDAALSAPSFLAALISALDSAGSAKRADALRERLLTIAAASSGARWTLLQRLLSSQRPEDHEAARAWLAELRAQAPWSETWLTMELNQLRQTQGADAAIAQLDQWLAHAPGDLSALRLRAELLVAAGRQDEAAQTMRRVLSLRPQDQDARDYLAYLTPDSQRFHEVWMVQNLRELADKMPAGAFATSTIVDQTVVQVGTNGLAQRVRQRVVRVNRPDGISAASSTRVAFQNGDEEADALLVRVHKPDGAITEDFNSWTSGGSRKANTTYNDTSYLNVHANNVEVGDLVEIRTRLSQVANRNFRGDYFGDLEYVQDTEPIAYARYALIYPKNWTMYFKHPTNAHSRVDDRMPDGSKPADGMRSTAFELRDVPYVKTDADQPGYTEVYDYILVSNKKTYDEVGQWWWNLVKEQLIVDEPIRTTVQRITKGLKTDDEKVRAIYDYVVKNTRYLHVGLGIHGWKPYRTSSCFRNRYGDCKDKAALLKVMLEEAGVKANLVLVRTRQLGKVAGEPASMHIFNHAITYVPSLDLFLDGTAEFNGTRELTTMDQGALALIVEDGGKTRWVTLPVDKPEQNIMRQTLVVDLSGEQPVVEATAYATGANAVYWRSVFEEVQRRSEALERELAATYPGAHVRQATFSPLRDLERPVELTYSFTGGQFVREAGARRYIYPLGAPKDLLAAYAKQSKRDQDLVLRVPFVNEMTVRYKLPANAAFGALPRGSALTTPFGSFKLDYAMQGAELLVTSRYSIDRVRITAAEYPAFRQYVSEITAALSATIEVRYE
jgi:transglutaminase-like putative cysteine protease/Tfp pilus assembly protein PilF